LSDAPHEVELKLRITAAAAAKVLQHPAVADLKRARARTTKLRSVYFDTPDRRLAGAGVALRLRQSGRDWLQTVKGPATGGSAGGLNERVECEWRLARSPKRPPLDLHKLATTPYRRAIEKATRHAALAPVFVTRVERTTVPLRFADQTTAQLSLDRGVVHAGERSGPGVAREPIVEIELELESGDATRLFDLALELSDDLPIAVETRSKAARGYDLVAPRRASAVTAEAVSVPKDATAADAIAAVIRNCLRQVEANADGVRVGDDPEWVHQMRVGVRRLRCGLALLRRAVAPEVLQPLQAELRWLAGVLGRVRDLDVFALDTLTAIASATQRIDAAGDATAAPIDVLDSRTRKLAAEARNQARAAIDSPRFAQLLLATGRLASSLPLGMQAGTPEGTLLSQPARVFAVERLKRRHRKLHRAGDGLDGTASQRHEVRIQAKKMRYASEFFAPLFPAKRARGYRKALATLQQVLGATNDAAVATTLASELAPDSPSASLVAGWAGAQADTQDRQLKRAWRDFSRAKPFWTGH
jgi:triphosphatase